MFTSRHFYLTVIFWVGFSALIYQIYSIRVLFMFFIENTHAVSLAISSFLAGLACSSLFFSRIAHRTKDSARLMCLMMLAAGIYGYILLTHYYWIPQWLDAIGRHIDNTSVVAALKYTIMWFYLFLPAFFIGGAFPLANGLYLRSLEDSTRDTGVVYFWDTLGAIAGALTAGFLLLPCFGLRVTVISAVAINFLLAAALMPKKKYAYSLIVFLFVIIGLETA